MITKSQATVLKRAITEYVRASIVSSWIGTMDPEDHESVVANKTHKQRLLAACIERITEKTP